MLDDYSAVKGKEVLVHVSNMDEHRKQYAKWNK